MRAAFGGGVLHEFAKRGFFADIMATASAGVPTAAYYVANDVEEMHKIWTDDLDTSRFIRYDHIFTGKPIFDTSYLLSDIMRKKRPLSIEALMKSKTQLVFPLYDYVSRRLELRTSRDADFAHNAWSYFHLAVVVHDTDILWGTPFERYIDGAIDPFAMYKLKYLPENARVVIVWNEPRFDMHAVKYLGQKIFLALQGRHFPEEVKRMLRTRAELLREGLCLYEAFCARYNPLILKPEANVFDGFNVVARSGSRLGNLFEQGRARASKMFDEGQFADFV